MKFFKTFMHFVGRNYEHVEERKGKTNNLSAQVSFTKYACD